MTKTAKPNASNLIALGSNLTSGTGTSAQTLREAIELLKIEGAVIRATSPFYHTPAFPAGSGPDFVNAAIWLDAAWTPEDVLAVLHRVEAQLGRTRDVRWGKRTIDLDLIAQADVVLPDPATHNHWRTLDLETQMTTAPDMLILPHPRLQDRAFVLVPLADIAPDWRHPLLGLTVTQMRDALPKRDVNAVRLAQ